MTIPIEKSKQLSHQQQAQLFDLYQRCCLADAITPKLYQAGIEQRDGDTFQDFFILESDKMIAYLGCFDVANDIEVTAFIDPQYRRLGYFTALLEAAMAEMRAQAITEFNIIVPADNDHAVNTARAMDASLAYDEYQLELDLSHFHPTLMGSNVRIRLAERNDIVLLASIEESCSGYDFDRLFEHHNQTIDEPETLDWIAYVDNLVVGKCHAGLRKDVADLHNLSILPTFRGQGFEVLILQYQLSELSKLGAHKVTTTVQADCEGRLELFESQGFQRVSHYQYWARFV